MKKSIFATFLMLFALFAAPSLYAEELPDIQPTADEPLPPMVDPSIADDTSGN